MESVLLSARCTANTATVFWNKPENATADTVYEVSLDGGHSVHTNRTHYTFTELIPNTEYCVTVYNIGSIHICTPVSYTHLDVYKRQVIILPKIYFVLYVI